MAILRPFRALRPLPELVDQIAAVPYDVVNRKEAAQLASSPLSFLHVSRAEIDLPEDVDPYDERVYEKAAANFSRLIAEGSLVRDDAPALYIYRLVMGEHTQVGVAATYSIDEYDEGLIKKHEFTRKVKEDDRTKHILALRAQTGPVFLTYKADKEIDRVVSKAMEKEPLYDFTAPDGVSHTMWRMENTDELVALFSKLPALYIADGHHRAASASRARQELGCKKGEAGNFFLAVAFPSDQVQILAYNRVVRDLGDYTPKTFLEAISKRMPVEAGASPEPVKPGCVSLYINSDGIKGWYSLNLPLERYVGGGVASKLDCAVLQAEVFEALLGITDIRTDERIDFVGGIRGTTELVRLVDSGSWAAAFSMYPTSLEQLMEVADAGEVMPPKSTWFEPKLRDGLVCHRI